MDKEKYQVNVQLRTQERFAKIADEFVKAYDLVSVQTLFPNIRTLKKPSARVCRFCSRNSEQTSFRKKAHLIPHFLGNNVLFSDFECDKCNEKFGFYENHLANLLGAERTIGKVQGKIGIPKFKSPNKDVVITAKEFNGKESIQITRSSTDNSTFEHDKESGIIHITFRKNSHIPNAAYRCLLKIGLSIMTEEESNNYSKLKEYLCGRGQLDGCPVLKYEIPFGPTFEPHVFLFRKKNPSEESFTHFMSFCCLNQIFWIPIMLHDEDLGLFEKRLTMKVPPPLFIQKGDIENLLIGREIEDWSSTELQKDGIQEFNYRFNNPDFNEVTSIDPETGERITKPFDVKEIVSLIIVPAH